MKIALHNPHKLPNLTNWKIHNYVVEMVRQGHVHALYFDDPEFFKNFRRNLSHLKSIYKKYSWQELGFGRVKWIFSEKKLNAECDMLLNFNCVYASEFTPAVKRFNGIKIFHIMDYFWSEPGSAKYARLKEYGVDYLMAYGSPDKYCAYFQKFFPDYRGKVIPIPFGFTDRFVSSTPFEERLNKCVALGSVNPLRPQDANPINYKESADFYSKEEWFHKFRRMIVENRESLSPVLDSMLPVFPAYKDSAYDIVKKLNEYKMFTCDESIFYFPAAKAFEGPAAGTVMVCSDHPCFSDYGFIDGVNCIVHKQFSIEDLRAQIKKYQDRPADLKSIQEKGTHFARTHYSQKAIAQRMKMIFDALGRRTQKANGKKIDISSYSLWKNDDFLK